MSRKDPSRRAALGAAVGLPLLPRHCEERGDEAIQCGGGGGAGSVDLRSPSARSARNDEAWERALAAFRSAEAEVRGFERATAGSSVDDEEAWLPAYEARLEAHSRAVRGVMLAAAPDFGAFARKLSLFFDHELEPNTVDEDIVAALRADSRRLAR